MADLCDQADIQNTLALEIAVKCRRKPEGPQAKGNCHYCGEDLEPGKRWCDSYCCELWEKLQSPRFPVA